jgi:hypothetical protein
MCGTWTVWISYHRSSQVALKVEAAMEAAWQDDEKQQQNPDRDLAAVLKGPLDARSIVEAHCSSLAID